MCIRDSSTGEEFDIEVKFSDSYPGTDVAGKVARFHIVLNEIYKQNIPELTDEWVASNSKTAKTADEYLSLIHILYPDREKAGG